MKRLILFVSVIIFGICGYFLHDSSFEFKKYSNANSLKRKINNIDEKIKNFDSDINSKEIEIDKIKEEKSEDVRLLEVWKKEVEKVS